MVRVVLTFKGREIQHKELGMKSLDKIKNAVYDLGKCSENHKVKGPQVIMMIQPK